jgi:hypothetical protein
MGPWFGVSRSERQAALLEEINQLPRAFRTALILCVLERRPIEQVARDLGCPVKSLAIRLARALEGLRVRMARRYYGIPVGTWDSDILTDLRAIVPESLVESTVAAATHRHGPSSGSRSRSRKTNPEDLVAPRPPSTVEEPLQVKSPGVRRPVGEKTRPPRGDVTR